MTELNAALICNLVHDDAEGCVDAIAHLLWVARQIDHFGLRTRQFRHDFAALIEAATAAGEARGR